MKTLILLAACLGLALFGMGFVILGKKIKKHISGFREKCTSLTYGTVIQMEERRLMSGDSSYTWYPHYEFYVDGERVEAIGAFGLRPHSLQEGQRVTICYNPGNPSQAYAKEEPGVNAFNIFSFVGWAFVVVSVVTAIVGFILFYVITV